MGYPQQSKSVSMIINLDTFVIDKTASFDAETMIKANDDQLDDTIIIGAFESTFEICSIYEGQEDQLNVLGLATNAIVWWNTVYMQAALEHLRAQGEVIKEEDEARLSPLGRKHINFLGHFSFMLPKVVTEGQLRPIECF
jgi:hypothetical protein